MPLNRRLKIPKRIALEYLTISDKIFGIYKITKNLKKGATVLFYHGVEEEIIDQRIQHLHIALCVFESHINYLRKNFEIVSLDYLYNTIANGYRIDPGQVLITFDDGYKNNLAVVAPFLKACNIPFTVFISTKNISDGIRFPFYYLAAAICFTEHNYIDFASLKRKFDISTSEKRALVKATLAKALRITPQRTVNLIVNDLIKLIPNERWLEINQRFFSDEPMDWDDVRKLIEMGATIGAHCHEHCILHNNQPSEEIAKQLEVSKNLIEKNTGLKCNYFAYPNGGVRYIATDSLNALKENGFLLGFSSVRAEVQSKTNVCIMPRIGVQVDLDLYKFAINNTFIYNYSYNRWAQKFNKKRMCCAPLEDVFKC